MILKTVFLGLDAGGKAVAVLHEQDAEQLGAMSLARITIRTDVVEQTAIVHTSTDLVQPGHIGVCKKVWAALGLEEGVDVEVNVAPFPASLLFIRNKLMGRKLVYDEILNIVEDTIGGKLSDVEIAAFVTALHCFGLDLDEATNLSRAMVKTGNMLKLDKQPVVDKHSIGGVPGDKTTLLVVPIIAACGLPIPKTSSRAITSAAGTADRAEVLMPVSLDMGEMQEVVERTDGCIVWGGSVHLAPADDIFVKVEYPLSIDPLLLPSIMSKKKSVGADLLVVDIPCGRGAKVKTIGEADLLAKDFMEIGSRMGMQVRCAVTYGEQPVGYAIGPSLEAKEALEALMNRGSASDVVEKAIAVAGMILEMAGKENGREHAAEALRSGKAEMKMREIIEAQGGDPRINPEDIALGSHQFTLQSDRSGIVLWINNALVADLARFAGCPKDSGAGILLHKKLGDIVDEGESLFTIYAERSANLQHALDKLENFRIMGIGNRIEMLIHEVKERPVTERTFALDR
ncbi:MAG: AMP phosphorylase [Methanothrix sp.]|uniref:AMP phosphorylase n=1 Tax=Methanothrix sp. TaxID=90426 RepID=UPI0032AEB6DE|nr:AMP phosphorylase [Methanothrix sp.]